MEFWIISDKWACYKFMISSSAVGMLLGTLPRNMTKKGCRSHEYINMLRCSKSIRQTWIDEYSSSSSTECIAFTWYEIQFCFNCLKPGIIRTEVGLANIYSNTLFSWCTVCSKLTNGCSNKVKHCSLQYATTGILCFKEYRNACKWNQRNI